jgi:hypothetical protein
VTVIGSICRPFPILQWIKGITTINNSLDLPKRVYFSLPIKKIMLFINLFLKKKIGAGMPISLLKEETIQQTYKDDKGKNKY